MHLTMAPRCQGTCMVRVITYPDYATNKCPQANAPWLNTLFLNTQIVKALGTLFDHHGPLFLQSYLVLLNTF